MQTAQTNLQLFNQLREKGLPLHDLALVNRAYELSTKLYSGWFQADGKPFVAHSVGVASIVAELDQPAEIIAVGLLHNVYGNGDFGDGRVWVATPSRRRLVRAEVGERVEELIARFQELRILPRTVERVREMLPSLGEVDRRLIRVDLADHLEKHVDLGVLYWSRGDSVVGADQLIRDDLIAIAYELGEPTLAETLASAFADTAASRNDVPAELRPSDGRAELKLVVPRSCRPRSATQLRRAARSLRTHVRLRTRLRALLSMPPRRSRA
jgi:(p)ppGpp synthase/HD superfamily hydrolase